MLNLNFGRLFGKIWSGKNSRRPRVRKPVWTKPLRTLLHLECLEDRVVPSSFLGSTTNTFAVLAGSSVNNTGPTVINGNLGVSPGGAITGFAPGVVIAPGTIHAGDPFAAAAQGELTTSYNNLAGLPFTTSLTGQDLGGKTLLPGVYNFTSSAQLTGTLTLDTQGNPNALFVFQIGSTLTTASNSAVVFANGATDDEVYWQVGSSASLGTNTAFAGNILALASISLVTGSTIQHGRALARNGAVTMDSDVVSPRTLNSVSTPAGIATGDINGDGKPDLIQANFSSGTVSVLLNTTANGAAVATLAEQQIFAVGTSPYFVAVGDINSDAKLDLAIVNESTGAVSVLMNTTAPGATVVSFAPLQTFAVGNGPESVSFADINADGRADLVVTNTGSATVSVLMNTTPSGVPMATFAAQQTFVVGSFPYANAAIGDINGDGRPDLVIANLNDSSIGVLLNTTPQGATASSFAAQQTFADLNGPAYIALADLNGDGRPDLIVANFNANNVSVFMNITTAGNTAATFAAPQTFANNAGPAFGIVAGDFTSDGRLDFALGNGSGTSITVFKNTTAFGATTASFTAGQVFTTSSTSDDLVAADFNFDGRVDLAVANANTDTVSVLLNNLPSFIAAVTTPVVVGDFKGYGIQQYNQTNNSYVQLSPFDPTVLAVNAEGWVVGNFSGYGVQLYRPGFNAFGSFVQLTPATATLLSMDASGDIVGNFAGYGIQLYRPATGWAQITPFQSTQLAFDGYGNVYSTFTSYGIQEYSLATNGWKVITPYDPTTFAVNAYDQIVAVFTSYGVEKFTPFGGWTVLTTSMATSAAINSEGVVFANFPGYGVQEHPGSGINWIATTPMTGQFLAIDRYGHAYGDFPGIGVYIYTPQGQWNGVGTNLDPALLAVADWPFDLSSPF